MSNFLNTHSERSERVNRKDASFNSGQTCLPAGRETPPVKARFFSNAVARPRMFDESFPAWCLFALLLVLPLLAGGNELYGVSSDAALLMAHLLVLLLAVVWWVMRLDQWAWASIPPMVMAAGIAFLAVQAASTVTSITPYQSEWRLLQVGIGLVLAYAALDLLRTEQAIRRAAWAVLWGGGIVAAYGIEQGVFGLPNWLIQAQRNRASQDLVAMVSQGRVFGTFLNVNAFAAYLAMTLPIGGYLLVRAERIRSQLLAAGLLLCIVMALAMTGSKGGWGAAIAALAATGALLARGGGAGRLIRRVGLVALTGLLLVGFVWSTQPGQIENPMERLFSVTMGLKQSAEGRWSYWRGAAELVEAHPLLGVGPGAFGAAFQQVQQDGHYARYAHNLYLQLASETGLAGLAAFLALIGAMVWRGVRVQRHREFAGVLLVGALALLLHGAVDFSWEIPANQWLFFLLCGMVLACDRLKLDDGVVTRAALPHRWRVAGTLAAVPVAVALLLAIGRPYLAEGYLQSAIAASIADDTGLAVALGREAVRYAPRSARTANFLASAYRRQWEKSSDGAWLERAAGMHRAAIELAPVVGLYHDEFGNTLWAQARRQEAVAAWRTAHERYPANPAFAVQLGRGLWMTGETNAALALLQETSALEPLFVAAGSPELLPFYDLHFLLAKIYDAEGRLDAAFDEYDRIIDLAERGPERIAYGPLLAGRIAIQPKLWYASKSYLEMGDLHQRQGRPEEALSAYRRAVEMDANYEKAKQRIEALEAKAGVKKS